MEAKNEINVGYIANINGAGWYACVGEPLETVNRFRTKELAMAEARRKVELFRWAEGVDYTIVDRL
jgi:hypothetical protein